MLWHAICASTLAKVKWQADYPRECCHKPKPNYKIYCYYVTYYQKAKFKLVANNFQ